MTISYSTLMTAGLLAGLILAGSLVPVHAGDGCGKDKKTSQTTSMSPSLADGQALLTHKIGD